MKDLNWNTLLLAIVVGLGGWNLYTTHQMGIQIENMRGQLSAATKNRWNSTHQAIWSGKLQEKNPSLHVPDAGEILRQYDP